MSAACEGVRAMLPGYALEALAAQERIAVREHLRGCAACRSEAASADPALLFAALPAEGVSDADVASVVASVRAGIALRQTERRIAGPAVRRREHRRRSVRAAAAAVVLLTLAVPSGLRSPVPEPSVTAAVQVPAAVVVPASAAKAPGASTVYDFNPGAGEPRVVWIVDESLDI